MKKLLRVAFALTASTLTTACSTALFTSDTIDQQTWVLHSIGTQGPVGGKPITLTFQPTTNNAGRIFGSGPCNRFFGSYTLKGNTVNFSPVGNTKMACPPEVMAQERMFMAAFEHPQQISLADKKLIMTNQNQDNNLTFLAESAQVEGQITFQDPLPGDSIITIRLDALKSESPYPLMLARQAIKLSQETRAPVNFSVHYAPHLIHGKDSHSISVRIMNRGKLLYSSQTPTQFKQPMTIMVKKPA